MNSEIKIGGIYKHFKGNSYKVLNVGTHSETEEVMVVYMKLYDDYGVWIRPLELFVSKKEVDGELIDRFKLLE